MKGIVLQELYRLKPCEFLEEFEDYGCEVDSSYMCDVYEYACLTAEFQGIDPKKAKGFVNYLMTVEMSKALNVVKFMRFIKPNEKMSLRFPNRNNIEDIVKKEHGNGIPINSESFEENEINLKTSMFHY